MAIQTVNLADNINAAILKINQNFDEIETGVYSSTSTSDVTNIVNNILDSDYFLSIINQTYIDQFTITTSVDFTDVDAGIAANASAVASLTSSISTIDGTLLILAQDIVTLNTSYTNTQSGISANSSAISSLTSSIAVTDNSLLVVAADITALEVEVDGLVLDGVDSAVLASAIASANTTLISSINAVDGDVTVLSAQVTALDASLTLLDTNTGIATTANANANSTLSATVATLDGVVTANAGLVTALGSSVDSQFATVNSSLTTISSALGSSAVYALDLDVNNHIAGIRLDNNGTVANFAVTADTFKVINASNNEIQPFTINGNQVELTNATVTGNLNIGSSLTGAHTEMQDDVIKVFDAGGQIRVHLGNLTA